MKPVYENIEPIRGADSFVAYAYETDGFPFKWHYHPEYELTLITAGSGKRLVGDSYETFTSGDLVLLGTNLPHTWVSEPSSAKAASVVIQFSDPFIRPLLQYAECTPITALLHKSCYGLQLEASAPVVEKIIQQPHLEGVAKLTGLLELLNLLRASPARKLCASVNKLPAQSNEAQQRINIVCNYLHRHYGAALPVTKIAELIHLSPGAFCKFFKKTTGKLFSDYVNEIRISRACVLLLESDQHIATIASRVGYESMTYFNRIFYRKKAMTPRQYRSRLQIHREF